MIATKPNDQVNDFNAGTPRDYSEDMYRFYLELADCSDAVKQMIEEFLPQHHAARIVDLKYGFEFEMPIQCAPDLAKHLMSMNVAIYQLVRLSKTKSEYRKH